MSQKLRCMNENGMNEFRRYLIALRQSQKLPPPWEILSDDTTSELFAIDIEIDRPIFESRFDMGVYLVDKLRHIDSHVIEHHTGLWSWLALYYFDQLCPSDTNWERAPRENYTYLLSRDYRHHSRHAIRTTWHFVRLYGEKVRFMFSKPPHERGEIIEQLAARQELAASPGVISAANILYDDAERKTFKRGAAGRKAGSIWRFISVLQQFRLTYDLYDISGEDLTELLPPEFDRFRNAP